MSSDGGKAGVRREPFCGRSGRLQDGRLLPRRPVGGRLDDTDPTARKTPRLSSQRGDAVHIRASGRHLAAAGLSASSVTMITPKLNRMMDALLDLLCPRFPP